MNTLAKTATALLAAATLTGLGAGAANAASTPAAQGGDTSTPVTITMSDTYNEAYGTFHTTVAQLNGKFVCADENGRDVTFSICYDGMDAGKFELQTYAETGDGDAWETTVTEGSTTLFHGWLQDPAYVDITL